MLEFFAICEYFEITPIEFFDKNLHNPKMINQVFLDLEQLSESDLNLIHLNIIRLLKK